MWHARQTIRYSINSPPASQTPWRLSDHVPVLLPPCVFIIVGMKVLLFPSPHGLTVQCLAWTEGLISLNVSVEKRPTFRCTYPLTDKEAAPLLPASAADPNAVSLWRRKWSYLLDKSGNSTSACQYLQAD